MNRVLVYGLAVAGASVVRALQHRGVDVLVADDDGSDARRRVADDLGVELVVAPDEARLRALVASSDAVCPAPGVPETHAVIGAADRAGVELVSEIELAYRWEQDRPGGPRPMLAITGTDGKTTTTLLTVAMLRATGASAVDAGNTETPLVDAIERDDPAFVVECTSFRLAWTPSFRPDAGAWLNLAPDHLNWHRSMDTYEAAKARIWANQRAGDVAIGFAPDPVVRRRLADAPGRRLTFGSDDADYRLVGDDLVGPAGAFASRTAMRRRLPHDVTNALAAGALVLESGLADADAVAAALADFVGPPHRLERVGEWDGVAWYNDSKATTPHAAAVAIRAFDQIVLIAGGKDKHVDLAEMARDLDRIDAVVAIGETRDAIAAAFDGVGRVERTEFLDDAVEIAASIARPGSTVLLSPGCASLDQFTSFEARGDRFRHLVVDRHRTTSTSTSTSTSDNSTPSPDTSTPTTREDAR